MADDPIKSFMVSLGFTGDAAGAKKVVDLAQGVEDKVTKAAEDGAEGRIAAEQNASNERIGIIKALGKIFVSQEQDRADRTAKIKKDEAAKDEKLQAERARKEQERRAKAVKELQVHATRMAAFALKTVGAVEAAALGVVYATERAARGFEKLNYASQRAGTTPGKMTAFAYAAEQTGGDAGAAQSALDVFGGKMRMNGEAYARQLRTMGIEAKNANGQMRDSAEILTDLGQKLAQIRNSGPSGYGNALGYASMFGMDENTMLAVSKPEFRQRFDERQAIDAKTGADQGAAAAGGTAFEQSFRRLEAMADSIRTKVSTNLFVALTPELDKLAKWADEHGEQIASVIDRVAKDIIALAHAVSDELAKVDWDGILTGVEGFAKDFDTKTKEIFGENGPIIATMAAFGVLVGAKLLGPLNLVLSTLGAIGKVPLVGRLLGGAISTAGAAVALGASAESTPTAPVTTDPAERARKLANNTLPAGEMTPEERESFQKQHGGSLWDALKRMVGLGPSDPDSRKVKDAIITTAEGVKKLADNAGGVAGGFGGVTASSGGLGGSGQHFGGGSSAGASLGDRGHGGHGFGHGEGPSDPNLPTGNVPGASGFGAINAYYKGALDKNNQNGLGPKAQYDYLRSIGASENEALLLTGAAANESNFNPGAIHDHGTGYGMFGHNTGRLDLRGKGWQEQDRLALAEMRRMFGDRVTKARSPEEVADYEMHYERPQGYHKNSPRSGHNYMGRLNTIRRFSALAGRAAPAAAPSAPVGDQAALDAQNRIAAGSGTPADHATIAAHRAQQNTPPAHGKPLPSWMAKDGTAGGITTVDYRDPKFAPGTAAKPVHVEVTDKSIGNLGKALTHDTISHHGEGRRALMKFGEGNKIIGKATREMLESRLHLAATQAMLRAHHGYAIPGVNAHSSLARHIRHSIDASRRVSMNHAPVFNINGVTDTGAAMADAHRLAGRGQADMVRNMSVMMA